MGQRKQHARCRWLTHYGVHLDPGLLVHQMTKFEVKGVEGGVDIRDKLVPCLSAVVELYVER